MMPPPRIGTLLVHVGAITPVQLETALASQRTSGHRLGAELQRLGYADGETVLRSLASQAGVSYLSAVDSTCVRTAPGGLCAEEVRALGVVPLRAIEADHMLIVACAAPLPCAALDALRALTNWIPVPYFVTDEDLEFLTKAYCTAATVGAPTVTAAMVESVNAAAQGIAAAAWAARDITVAQARLEPYTWIRVAGKGGINAMFLSGGADDYEEEKWLAATTRH